MIARLAAALASLLPLAALAQTPSAPAAPRWQAALTGEHSQLDNGYADWNSATLQLSRRWSQRQLAEIELTRTRRFGQDDTEIAVGGAVPLGDALTATLRASHSPTHNVLARSSVGAALQYEFRPAWLLHGGLRHTRYDATDVDQASVMLEHYFGDFSVLAAAHRIRAFDRHTGVGELRASWYYADRSSAGVVASAGREVAQVGPGVLAIARVRSLALVGLHALDERWSLRWGVHHVRQGGFYTRRGVTLGVQATF